MTTITFYPLGNADSYLLELATGEKLLFDYAACRNANDAADKRIDLAGALKDKLRAAGRDYVDVVAFTHLDDDHIHGASEFFELRHAQKYQGAGRIRINELWVPAAAIVEEGPSGEARILRSEARHRLIKGSGIRVFSRPDSLATWLKAQGLSLAERQHLITDAGQLVPGFTAATQGVEFFVHSPFAEHADDGSLVERNKGSLVLQATFLCRDDTTRVILGADADHEVLSAMVRVTRYHHNEDRLRWNVIKIPHHSSYKSLSNEQGAEITVPVPDVEWLYEKQGEERGILISTSWPIPADDSDKQPPHRQAAAYYRKQAQRLDGEFCVTMTHPSELCPEPLVVDIDRLGATIKKPSPSGSTAITSVRAPRAG